MGTLPRPQVYADSPTPDSALAVAASRMCCNRCLRCTGAVGCSSTQGRQIASEASCCVIAGVHSPGKCLSEGRRSLRVEFAKLHCVGRRSLCETICAVLCSTNGTNAAPLCLIDTGRCNASILVSASREIRTRHFGNNRCSFECLNTWCVQQQLW